MASSKFSIIACLALLSLTVLSSVDARHSRRLFKKRPQSISISVAELGFTLPLSNGSATLPGPPKDAQLAAIGIGRGIEYYTCDSETAVPKHTGGKADIYDASEIIPYLSGEQDFHNLVKYFYNYNYAALENSSLQLLGVNYYNPFPVFDLGEVGWFGGSVDYSIDSPLANAAPRAINWAQESNTTENSTIHNVFRVETFGGGGPCDCRGQPQTSTWQYACEYWFYV